jgi:hypothetical protein
MRERGIYLHRCRTYGAIKNKMRTKPLFFLKITLVKYFTMWQFRPSFAGMLMTAPGKGAITCLTYGFLSDAID